MLFDIICIIFITSVLISCLYRKKFIYMGTVVEWNKNPKMYVVYAILLSFIDLVFILSLIL